MPMNDKLLGLLGLMKRANALQVGEENTGRAVRAGKAKLILIASNASDNARKRAEGFLAGRSEIKVDLPFSKEDLSDALGTGLCALLCITDSGFADAFVSRISAYKPAYGDTVAQVRSGLEASFPSTATPAAENRNIGADKRRN